jgi:hypothetical protein
LIDDREHYLPFDTFPWFRDATIGQLSRIGGPRANTCTGRIWTSI